MSKAAAVLLWIGPGGWLAERVENARRAAVEWDRIRADERPPGRLFEAVRNFSFFQMDRTVCVEGAEGLRDEERAELAEGLRAPAPGVTLILAATAGRGADKLRESLQGIEGLALKVETAAGGDAAASPEALAGSAGIRLAPDLAALLRDLKGDDAMQLRLEIEKLSLLVESGGEVSLDHWREVSSAGAAADGFRIGRVVLARDAAAIDAALTDWSNGGGGDGSVPALLGGAGYVLRVALAWRILTASGVAPDEARRRLRARFDAADQRAARLWSIADLAAMLSELRALDRGCKSLAMPAGRQLARWCMRAVEGARA